MDAAGTTGKSARWRVTRYAAGALDHEPLDRHTVPLDEKYSQYSAKGMREDEQEVERSVASFARKRRPTAAGKIYTHHEGPLGHSSC